MQKGKDFFLQCIFIKINYILVCNQFQKPNLKNRGVFSTYKLTKEIKFVVFAKSKCGYVLLLHELKIYYDFFTPKGERNKKLFLFAGKGLILIIFLRLFHLNYFKVLFKNLKIISDQVSTTW